MSNISCKELIDMFQQIGGKLLCNYNTKKCTLLPQDVKCNFQTDDNIGTLLWYDGQRASVPYSPSPTNTVDRDERGTFVTREICVNSKNEE